MSAQVTEAHKRLVATIVERAFRFAEGNHKITPELSQLIADSEAKATDQLRAERDQLLQQVANLKYANHYHRKTAETSRATETDRNNLRADLDAIKSILNEEKDRAERAEAELADLKANNRFQRGHSEGYAEAKADCEAELATERARLDWLDENAIPWSWLCLKKLDEIRPIIVTWESNLPIRAAIDAAMKEGA
tara:strand:+ start:427 stop:1008 length:582 start_codon:yes stop_codon:yes gene_type:complete